MHTKQDDELDIQHKLQDSKRDEATRYFDVIKIESPNNCFRTKDWVRMVFLFKPIVRSQ